MFLLSGGIYGQCIYINPKYETVIVKLSSTTRAHGNTHAFDRFSNSDEQDCILCIRIRLHEELFPCILNGEVQYEKKFLLILFTFSSFSYGHSASKGDFMGTWRLVEYAVDEVSMKMCLALLLLKCI